MLIKSISYENLNGLTNKFDLKEKANIFVGSNGCGKTTSLDCLAILLFGESFSYRKTLERHLDVKDKTKVASLQMIVATDKKIVDEDGKEQPIEIDFFIKMALNGKGEFSQNKFINGKKVSQKDYDAKICETFKVPKDLLNLSNINILRCLIDPNELENSDKKGYYNLVNYLTNVVSVEDYANNNKEFAVIRLPLAKEDYNIGNAIKTVKNDLSTAEEEIKYINTNISTLDKEVEELENNTDFEEYNKKIDEYYSLKEEISNLNNKLVELNSSMHDSIINDRKEQSEKILAKSEELNTLKREIQGIVYELQSKEFEMRKLENIIKQNEENIKSFDDRTIAIQNAEFKFKDIICQECGKVANSKDRADAEKEFKKNNAKMVEELEESKANAENEVSTIKENLTDCQKFLDEKSKEYDSKNEILSKAEEEFETLRNETVKYSKATTDLQKEIDSLNETINHKKEELATVYTYISDKQVVINYINNKKATISNQEKFVKEKLSIQADLEVKKNVLNDFNIAYAKEIEKAISSVFGDIKINLVKDGKTAGKEKINCYAIQDDKPFYNYNTAPQIALGCKVIQTLKNHLGVVGLPILFDIVDNIGEKAFNEIVGYCDNQLFCTNADFEENKELKLTNTIKENK